MTAELVAKYETYASFLLFEKGRMKARPPPWLKRYKKKFWDEIVYFWEPLGLFVSFRRLG
jgi:hypothetical protein